MEKKNYPESGDGKKCINEEPGRPIVRYKDVLGSGNLLIFIFSIDFGPALHVFE